MTFLQQSLLWGLFAASIPVIIHLLNRRRFRTVKWGAMQFLLRATRESRGKKRLKHILILICRTLAIAALVTAVARPLVGGLLGWGSGKVDTVILLLDRSPSMERTAGDGLPGKRQSILDRVSSSIKELGGARLILVDSGTGEAQEVPSPDVLPDLSATSPTDAAADIPAMLSTALDYIQEAKPGRTEIWIASDLQKPDWAPEDARWKAFQAAISEQAPKVQLRVLGMNTRNSNDYAIKVHSARREGLELVLDLEVTREEDIGPVSQPVTFSLLGARSATAIEIEGQSLRFQKRLPLSTTNDGGNGWVSIPTDTNPRNNVSFFAYGPEAPVHSYVVHEPDLDPEAIAALARAAAPGFAKQEVTLLPAGRAHLVDWNKASTVIWQAPIPTGTVAEQLLGFIKSGGVALFLPSAAKPAATIAGLGWEDVEESARGRYFIVKDWRRNDGPLRDGVDGSPIPLERIRAIKRRPISGESTTLATWDDESPLLVRRILDAGTVFLLNTLPDYTWSNLEQSAVHLVLIQRSLEIGARRFGAGFTGVAGEASARPAGNEIPSRLDTYATFAEGAPVNASLEAGVYRFGNRTVAVNRPAAEDSIDLLTRADVGQVLEGTGFSFFEDASTSKDPLFREAWRSFLFAMLIFLIGEAILCLQPRKPAATLTGGQPVSSS
jgi:hypothetical protein